MKQYHDLLQHILDHGKRRDDRTGTGTYSVFGPQIHFNLQDGFPLMTTKKLHIPSIFHEVLWFLSGSSNIEYLRDNNVSIWNAWADSNGELGPVYPVQWRKWTRTYEYVEYDTFGPITYLNQEPVDQIANVISEIKRNPDSRRLLVNAWNVGDLPEMALPPCHFAFQFYVDEGKLSCKLYQRSADCYLGIPFNIASYALLTHMIAHVTDLDVGELIISIGDAHLYADHVDQARLQLTREPYPLPKLRIKRKVTDIDDFKYEDFEVVGYQAHPHIKARVSV